LAEIHLPWPDSALSPNARCHWSKKAAWARKHRQWAYVAALAAGGPALVHDGVMLLRVTAYPKDRRRRDADNLLAALKSTFDGIADALKVDDSRFRPRLDFGEPRGAWAKIIITVEALHE
jgi:crossover junction endodeoxyribonuclease RusA